MTTTKTTLETLLETDRFPAIARLYSWGTNYDSTANPFNLFLDLIGFAKEEWGLVLFDLKNEGLDYASVTSFADAMQEWCN